MYTYGNLAEITIEALHHAFLDAFFDYQVDISMSPDAFQTMLKRRGFRPECSIGAFTAPEHALVGFVLNGIRDWQGKVTAYDLGTGIVPRHRRRGISGKMLGHVTEVLKQRQVEQYLLEVLQENATAFELYKKQGFSVTREFLCYRLDDGSHIAKSKKYDVRCLENIGTREWERFSSFWDFEPSWQNALDCIRAVRDKFVVAVVWDDHSIVGYGIVEKDTGDVPQIAVHKEHRKKGIATAIITFLTETTASEGLRVLNVDSRCDSMRIMLSHLGFKLFVSQYEMIRIEQE